MFQRLKIYTVHTKPNTRMEDVPPYLVKEGVSWPGFFCGFLWLFYHRLWLVGALNTLFFVGVMMLSYYEYLSAIANGALQLGQCVFIGLEGNNWLRSGLARRGYITAGVVTGENLLLAQRRYFEQYALEKAPLRTTS